MSDMYGAGGNNLRFTFRLWCPKVHKMSSLSAKTARNVKNCKINRVFLACAGATF